ncbi:MAG: type III-B CRISPR module RAMP protein Cmr1 [bacterium]
MRTLPKIDGAIVAPKGEFMLDLSKDSDGNVIIKQERKYELITPLYGGGVEAGKNDDITAINGKTIRGHLRFWWRSTRGGQFGGNLEEMKKREAVLWGGASGEDKPSPSKVQVGIKVTEKGSPIHPFETNGGWRNSSLLYAAFPLQETNQAVSAGIKFTLMISYPIEENSEIEAALWAWDTFGGIGARTRRGFGALKQGTLSAKIVKLQERITEDLKKHVPLENWHRDVPHLSKNLSFVIVSRKQKENRVPFDSVDEAWEHLIKELKDFRQSRSGRRFGRSKWPEPEQIRRITGQRNRPEDPILLSVEKFPRAVFGLPIIFHFKDGNEEPPYSPVHDPIETTLKGGKYLEGTTPKYRERLASPLILRPLACGNNKAVGLAVLLQSPRVPPEGLRLTGDRIDPSVQSNLIKTEALKIEPLKQLAVKLKKDDDELDVLEAFMDMLRKKENDL